MEIDKIVLEAFCEANDCLLNNNYTACALMCRKLLMNLAIAHEANEGLKFEAYIEYLQDYNVLTPDMDYFFDREPEKIRTLGNDAAHKAKPITKQNATDIINTSKVLLSLVYKFEKDIDICKPIERNI
jgi:hypothetical protein